MTDNDTYEYECTQCQGRARITVEGVALKRKGTAFWYNLLDGKCKKCLEKAEEKRK